ncbi:MAG: hypothetical protein ACK4TF_00825 [Thermodesulfovibrionales bacterium]
MLIPVLTAIHVITIILWIGGVAFVTINIFPILMRMEDSLEKIRYFQAVENRFARQARLYAIVAGITGAVILFLENGWSGIFSKRGLGILIMLLAWLVYVLILTFERNIFKVLFKDTTQDVSKIFFKLNVFHWFILTVSFLAVFSGVYLGHGGSF